MEVAPDMTSEASSKPTGARIITVNPVNQVSSGALSGGEANQSGSQDTKTTQNGKVSVTLSMDCIQNLIQVSVHRLISRIEINRSILWNGLLQITLKLLDEL